MNFEQIHWNMNHCLQLAEKAYKEDEVPIGAVIVDSSGKLISEGYNKKEQNNNPVEHAEIIAIQKACAQIGDWRLNGCQLYVTLEPCPMCLSAIMQSRIERVYFGTYDSKGGSLSLNYNLHNDKRLNHSTKIVGGILHFECSRILSQFFKEKRNYYKKL